jgi:oxygen-independent coproporphyrinogen-3 oxidase
MVDVGLYIHVPFCATRCGYCDFHTNVPRKGEMEPFVDALLLELDRCVTSADVSVRTIFVGGGTPSVLPTRLLRRLFDALGTAATEHGPVEFTVEVNPASLNDTKASIFRDAGVNRISMGVQSFHDHELRVLDRIHSVADIEPSAEVIRRWGFDHFSVDLIFGIPGQTMTSWRESLHRAVALGVDHLSCYGLTYEQGTPLRSRLDGGLFEAVNEVAEAEFYEVLMDQAAEAGFEQYEISNFARPGAESQHNLRYWRNEPVIGVGPSAASYLGGRRWSNVRDTAMYTRTIVAGDDTSVDLEQLSDLERAGETAMLRLRLNEGIDCEVFVGQTGFHPEALFGGLIETFAARGLLVSDGKRIALTRTGRLVADSIVSEFLSPEPTAAGETASKSRFRTT